MSLVIAGPIYNIILPRLLLRHHKLLETTAPPLPPPPVSSCRIQSPAMTLSLDSDKRPLSARGRRACSGHSDCADPSGDRRSGGRTRRPVYPPHIRRGIRRRGKAGHLSRGMATLSGFRNGKWGRCVKVGRCYRRASGAWVVNNINWLQYTIWVKFQIHSIIYATA